MQNMQIMLPNNHEMVFVRLAVTAIILALSSDFQHETET